MISNFSKTIFLLLILNPISLVGQADIIDSKNALEIGREMLSVGFYDSATIYFQKSIELSIKENNDWLKTTAQSELGKSWVYLREFEKAIEISNSNLNDESAALGAKIIAHHNLGLASENYGKKFYHNHEALKMALEETEKHFANPTANDSLLLSNKSLALNELAHMHSNAQNFDSARYYFNLLIDLAESVKPTDTFSLALHKSDLANSFLTQRRLADAKKVLFSTKPMIEQLSPQTQHDYNLITNFYSRLAIYYGMAGKIDSSLVSKRIQEEIMSESPLVDSVLFARTLSHTGIDYYKLGEMNKAWDYEQKAFALKKRILNSEDTDMALSYKLLGLYSIRGSYDVNDAVEYFRENLRINQKLFGRLDSRTVDAMHHLSYGLNHVGKYLESLNLGQKTLEAQKQISGNDYTTAAIYTAIADNLTKLDRLEESISVYNEMIHLSSTSKQNLSALQVNSKTGLATIYMRLGNFYKAEQYLKGAIKSSLEIYGSDNYILDGIYNQLAEAYLGQGMIEKALEANNRAINIILYDQELFKLDSLPLNVLARSTFELVNSYELQIQLLVQKLSKEPNYDPDEFWETFNSSIEIVENWISEKENNSDIVLLQSFSKALHSSGIDVLWLTDSTSVDKERALRMWQFSERSKAINQKIHEKKRQTSNPTEIGDQILEEQRIINANISNFKSMAINGNDHDSVSAGLFKALQAKKELEQRIKSEYPQDYSLNYLGDDISQDQLKAFLNDNQSIVDYFISGKTLHAFVINKESVHHFKFDWTEELKQQIREFKNSLLENSNTQKTSSDVYQTIFKPLEKEISGSNVIIIPDEDLWNINFDLLETSSSGIDPNAKGHYLLEKYAISYSYSTSALLNTKRENNSKRQVLAFSYGDNDLTELKLNNMRDAAKQNLPGTAKEVKNLSSTLSGDFYFGNQASEKRFKRMASNYSILHLALHGEVNDEDPDNSKLFFAKSQDETNDDNVLHTFELYDMGLNADLAVLSACNTGSGKVVNGEGIMSLGKAFQYAGVNSVLLSQWEVSDAIAPVIIENFYKYLKEGKDKAQALRLAKLDFLKSSNNITSSPYYWGSFFIIGNPEPISFKAKRKSIYWIIGVLTLVAMLFLIRKRKASNT